MKSIIINDTSGANQKINSEDLKDGETLLNSSFTPSISG
jgi:hypothetical protein